MKSVKYLTLAIPILVFAILEFFITKPAILFVAIGQRLNPIFIIILAIFLLVLIFYISARRNKFELTLYDLIFPLNLQGALLTYLVIQTDKTFVQFLIFINSFVLYLYFRMRLLSLRTESDEIRPTFLNIISFGNFLIMFFYSSSFYRLPFFVRISLWQLAIFFVVGAGFAVFDYYKTIEVDTKKSLFYTFFVVFVLTQLAWTLSFLPLKYTSLGMILALGYYILQGATKLQLSESLRFKNIKYYLLISVFSVIIILLTSRWL